MCYVVGKITYMYMYIIAAAQVGSKRPFAIHPLAFLAAWLRPYGAGLRCFEA